jgi:signal transduction histidine kinase
MAAATEKTRLLERVRRAEAATAEALGELDLQHIAVADARRAGRELVENATAALVPVLDELQGTSGVDEARRAIDDLILLADLRDGRLTPKASTFDPKAPLREAMRLVSAADPRVHLVAEEPIHDLPPVTSDVERIAVALARLLARAVIAPGATEVRASVAVTAGRVSYRVPGRAGDGLSWRIAAAIAELLGGSIDTEMSESGATVVFSVPIDRES